ncbi:MAG: hypothetical protein M3Q89_02940 [Verrucomicrobiota bacterium]|nr:hypothetical protein [Verrucomicrobiota bacterium]
MIARLRSDEAKAVASFSNARAEIEVTLRTQPDDAVSLSMAGRLDALLGNKEDALREGRRACEMRPIEQDAMSGAGIAVDLARIYAFTGEKELALEQLTRVVAIPNGPSYGELKLEMAWDSLRGDPRFEKLVASLAPKPDAR